MKNMKKKVIFSYDYELFFWYKCQRQYRKRS